MSNNNCFVTVHYNGQMVKSDVGVVFHSERPTKMRINKEITLPILKDEISKKIRASIHSLRYRWMTCSNPVIYSAIALEDNEDVAIMIAVHESMGIRNVELFAKMLDIPGPFRNATGESSQMGAGNEIDMFGGSFATMLAIGTSSGFHEGGPSTYAPSYGPTVDANVANLRGRWGESLEDSSEDEDIGDPDLFPNNVGQASNFGVGEFVPTGGDITLYEAPAHMHSVDFDAMRAPQFSDMPQLTSSQNGELFEGLEFKAKDEAILAIKEYSIRQHVDYAVAESNTKTFLAKCVKYGAGCNWKIRVTKRKKSGRWEVTKYNGDHTCLRTAIDQDHSKLDSSVISYHVIKLVEANPRDSVSTIQATVHQLFEYQVEYKKGWRAKENALHSVYGDYDRSYNELPTLLMAMTEFIPSTVVRYQTIDACDRQGQLRQGYQFFHRLFWAFKPCIDGFQYCKRMIQVDGTWLYGKYSHILLVAVAQDGESNVISIAFAIVEAESGEAWDFFLTNLCEHVVREDGVCIISDRGAGIKAAINREGSRWKPPYAYPAYYIRHIRKNSYEQFKNQYLCNEIMSMGYQLLQPEFERKMAGLMKYGERVWSWANNIERERWAQSYDEGGRRYGQMTTNLVECINGVLKESRHLLIASLVTETYYRLAKVWAVKGKQVQSLINRGQQLAPIIVEKMDENVKSATALMVHAFDRMNQTFDVVASRTQGGAPHSNVFRVDFKRRWCDCGEFQAWRYPGAHAVAACIFVNVNPYTYVDECFSLNQMLEIYKIEFPPIPNSMYWPQVEHDIWLPNPKLRRNPHGRPRSTRIYKSMDLPHKEKGQRKRCTICRGEGHSKSKCPNEPRYVPMPQ